MIKKVELKKSHMEQEIPGAGRRATRKRKKGPRRNP